MQTHLLHSNPEFGFQKAFEQDSQTIENLTNCFECLLNYLEIAKKQTQLKFLQFTQERLGNSLDLVLRELDPSLKKIQILLILYEVLSDPRVLLNQQISNKFFKILEIISQKLPALKLGDKILPGIFLLRGFSPDSFGCKWAKEILGKTEKITADDYDYYSFLQFYKCIIKEKSDFELDLLQVLELLGDLSEKMDYQGM
jgi:hypothetical protein